MNDRDFAHVEDFEITPEELAEEIFKRNKKIDKYLHELLEFGTVVFDHD